MVTVQPARFIVSRPSVNGERPALGALLEPFPDVRVLKLSEPTSAVVIMTMETAAALRARFPDLTIEPDTQHRPAGR
jgi:hypothetical protein